MEIKKVGEPKYDITDSRPEKQVEIQTVLRLRAFVDRETPANGHVLAHRDTLMDAADALERLSIAYDGLRRAYERPIWMLRHVVDAERLERLPGDHAVSVALLSVDEFLATRAPTDGLDMSGIESQECPACGWHRNDCVCVRRADEPELTVLGRCLHGDREAAIRRQDRSQMTRGDMSLAIDALLAELAAARHLVGEADAYLTAAREREQFLSDLYTAALGRAQVLRERERTLREAVGAALSELGVPDENYPAPVANAVDFLRAALAATEEQA